MHDEDLREEFAAWLRPVREAAPPELPVIRRRLRRRRARLAIGGSAALTAVAGIAIAVSTALAAPQAPAGPEAADQLHLSSNIPAATSGPHPITGGTEVFSSYTVSTPVSALKVYGGTITVTGSQRSTVAVSEHVTYFGSGSRPVMTRNLTGKTVTLAYGCSGNPVCAVSYDIRVPRDLDVLVDTSNGDIRLTSLAGSVTATADVGDITADGISSRAAGFLAVSGDISAVFTAAPTTVWATSAGGDITVLLPGTVSYQVNIRGGNGDKTVSVPQSFSSRHVINASSNEGDVTVAPS